MNKILLCTKNVILNFARTMTDSKLKLTEHSPEYIRNYLSQFSGGSITLTKNTETGVAIISLDHPEKRNAISGKMMVDLRNCVEELEKWQEGKAVIIHGKNGNFCSGGDLNFARASGTAQGGLNMSCWMQDTLKRLQKLSLFSVCLIEGPSLGGGAELSIYCDYIIAADNVKYGFVHGKMGIITAWGGATRLTQKIGHHKALDILLTSKILSANECLHLNIAELIVPASEALNKTQEWLIPRIQHHYSVVRAFKDVIYNALNNSSEESYNYEKYRFAPFWGSEVNKEALAKNIKHVKK